MKIIQKIINWTLGSFCRTLGRFLFYIALAVLSFFAFSWFKTVDAAELNVNAYIDGSLTYKTTNNIGYWRKDITISPNGDEYYINFNFELLGIKNGASYVVDTTICTTGEYYGYTSQSNISGDFAYIEILSRSNGGSCTISGYTGKYVNVSYYVKFYDDLAYNGESTSTYAGLANFKAWSGYTPTYNNIVHVFDIKMQEVGENYLEEYKTNSKLDQQINQNQTIIDQNNQTNSKLDDLNSNLTSTEGTDLSALENSAGWLPAGPVDSILNLPLTLLNNLTNNLSKSCQPMILPIPYVEKNLTFPCVNTLYEDMGVSVWANTIGAIASAFIMLSYLLKLYKWVDDQLSFRENNQIDNWGGI